MIAVPARDWSVFRQLFAEPWDAFRHAHPRSQASYYDGLVAKMLGCGNPDKMGYVEYRCLHCGQGKHLVAMSCKASLRVEHETVAVERFIGRMVQHMVPKGFKRIRYYGVQATKTFAKVKMIIHVALA